MARPSWRGVSFAKIRRVALSILCAAWPRSRRTVARLGAAAACLVACGCNEESYWLGGDELECDPVCSDGAELEFLDRMEDGDGTIDMTAGRAGFWFAFNDLLVGVAKTDEEVAQRNNELDATQYPDRNGETFPLERLDPPRGDSHYAVRSYGGGFADWGAGIGFELRVRQAYDLSQYAGISFWAKRGPNVKSNVLLGLPDSDTSPIGGRCVAPLCHDDFGAELSDLETEFKYYRFLWSELKTRNWSSSNLSQFDASRVYGVRFQAGAIEGIIKQDFDFWIDDVALLCHP